jgi:hypothetical protein
MKEINKVDALMNAVKSIESFRTAFEKSGLTINDLKNPNPPTSTTGPDSNI